MQSILGGECYQHWPWLVSPNGVGWVGEEEVIWDPCHKSRLLCSLPRVNHVSQDLYLRGNCKAQQAWRLVDGHRRQGVWHYSLRWWGRMTRGWCVCVVLACGAHPKLLSSTLVVKKSLSMKVQRMPLVLLKTSATLLMLVTSWKSIILVMLILP